jgi:translocation and assembly module TamA
VRLASFVSTVGSLGLAGLVFGSQLAVAAVDDAQPAPSIAITGADAALEANLLALLTVRAEPCTTSQARLRRLLPQVRRQLADAANALGYYHATHTARFSEAGNCWRLDIEMVPGPQVLLDEVELRVSGGDEVQRLFDDILQTTPLLSGVPLHHGQYEEFKSALSARAVDQGFFAARFERAEIALDLDSNLADVHLVFDPGMQYRIGAISILKDDSLDSDVIDGMLPVQEGAPYSSAALAEVRASLDASQYFRRIRVSPQIGAAQQQAVPVEIELAMRPRHAWTTGLGFTTDTGPRARLAYENRFVNHRGHRFVADSALSEVRNQLDGTYVIPLTDASRQSLNFSGGYSDENNDSFESESTKLEASIRNQNRAGWLQTVFIDTQRDNYAVAGQTDVSVLSTLGASLSRTKADNLINPNKGWKLFTQVRGASDNFLSDATFVQLYGSAKHVYGFGRSRLLSRVEIGATWINQRNELPASLRYFAGGDQSIRGYDYRELGPVNAASEVVGGKQLVVGSMEYDFQLRENWRVAVFADSGNAFNDMDDLEWHHSAGVGVRWLSPIGPVRVDLAHPLDGGGGIRLHVTMGPDL